MNLSDVQFWCGIVQNLCIILFMLSQCRFNSNVVAINQKQSEFNKAQAEGNWRTLELLIEALKNNGANDKGD